MNSTTLKAYPANNSSRSSHSEDEDPHDSPAYANTATIDLLHLVEYNMDGILVLDSEGRYLFVNLEAERILGTAREDVLGRTVWEVFPDADAKSGPFRQHFERAVIQRESSTYDSFSPTISRWLQVRLVPCSGHQTISGDERGVSVYFRDVTKLREAERSRREAEARFRVMADVAPVLIWTSGTDAKCDWFNKPRLAFTGRSMDEEVGNGWTKGVHTDDLDRCLKTYKDRFTAREPFTLEYRLKRHDGQWRWLLDNGMPRYNEVEEFVGYVGSCIDVTELKEAQERATHLLAEEQRLVAELLEASFRQRRFLREMLLGFTEGRLHLCNCSSDLPKPLPLISEPVDLTSPTIRLLRKQVVADAEALQFPEDRLHDFETAVGEASMNAVQHGGGGRGHVHGDPSTGVVQVWIEDHGDGIADDFIHRAVEQGWTTGGFGQGFFLMRSCADRIYLLTGPRGTTVVLEQERTPPEPSWLK